MGSMRWSGRLQKMYTWHWKNISRLTTLPRSLHMPASFMPMALSILTRSRAIMSRAGFRRNISVFYSRWEKPRLELCLTALGGGQQGSSDTRMLQFMAHLLRLLLTAMRSGPVPMKTTLEKPDTNSAVSKRTRSISL